MKKYQKKESLLSQEECFDTLIGMIKKMSREELIEFYALTEAYKAFHIDSDS